MTSHRSSMASREDMVTSTSPHVLVVCKHRVNLKTFDNFDVKSSPDSRISF